MISRRHIRVFISSPGDVLEERKKARQTIERLRVDPLLRDKVDLEEIAWDDPYAPAPLLGSMTPQEAISKGLPMPSECEIVVVIFWARMGTPLPPEYIKADGSRYLSGTEWEYWDAYTASQHSTHKLPLLLVYRCKREREHASEEDGKHLEQWKRVQGFFGSFMNPDGSIKQGYNTYQTPDDFAELLETHLKDLIKRVLETTSQTPISKKHKLNSFLLAGMSLIILIAMFWGLRWLTTREVRMTGQFNIALAQFALPTNSPERAITAFERIHQTVLNVLQNEYANSSIGVQVQPQRFGMVLTDVDAENLAIEMNASIVIYATVEYNSNAYKYTPHFYVASSFKNDISEIVGDNEWLQETITDSQLDDLINDTSDERQRLDLKAGILTEFTQALVYLTTNDLQLAKYAISQAIKSVNQYKRLYAEDIPFSVIYLFGSTIYRLAGDDAKAQDYAEIAASDPNYGRGQIALGHVFFDRGIQAYKLGDRPNAFNNLNIARGYYQTALKLSDQPLTAFVAEKAELSLGNIYQVLYQVVDGAQKPQLFSNAITNYQAVITSYQSYKNDRLIRQVAPLAAEAYRQMGSTYALAGQFTSAFDAYQNAIDISTNDESKYQIESTRSSLEALATATAIAQSTAP